MRINLPSCRASLVLVAGAIISMASVGCQSTVGGQTLPSPDYLRDDVQFFPAGSEDLVPNLRERLDKYRVDQNQLTGDDAGF